MTAKLIVGILLILSSRVSGQLTASLESNSQYYTDDRKIKLPDKESDQRFRSNNYLNLRYKLKDFTAELQMESYEPKALLNYNPHFHATGAGTYAINYYNPKSGLDITAGHIYEQFGSGLALRFWEDRQIGIANSLLGGKIRYTDPSQTVTVKAVVGKQRSGFRITDGLISGLDAEIKLDSAFQSGKISSSIGFSYVNRHENNETPAIYPENVSLYGSRIRFGYRTVSLEYEYLFKTKDNIKQVTLLDPNNTFSGSAHSLNLSYTTRNFGAVASFRRLENFNFYSQRDQTGNIYNNAILNYLPALTKQYDYGLANIYVYQAQPQLTFSPQKKAGEIGSQLEIFYTAKKGSFVGGKFGTELAVNISNWYGPKGKYRNYIDDNQDYSTAFLALGERYYADQSFNIKTKLKQQWSIGLLLMNQYYNTFRIEETAGNVRARTIVLDNTYKFRKSAVKLELQHQWADAYHGNWAAVMAEYYFYKNWSVYINDLYNYGNPKKEDQIHYYTGGMTFRKNATRIQLSYGRQRGGLLCVGGVCRFVPESSGFTLGISASY